MRSFLMQPIDRIKFIFFITFTGLAIGIFLTLLAWLAPGLDFQLGLLAGIFVIVGIGFFLIQRVSILPRPILFLAVLAATALVYLFPELFSPGCDGMPRAFAGPCPPKCQIAVCTNWDAPGENNCNPPPGALGCCVSYGTICDPDCEEEPPNPDTPPGINASLNCAISGNAGWCRGALSLELTATETKGRPILISGDINGVPFACPQMSGTSTCSVPLPEGAGIANYMATSSIGLSSNGSTLFYRDILAPTISKTLTGSVGLNGWYLSPVTYAASASDTVSGLSNLSCTLDGAPQAACNPILVGGDGSHTVIAQAFDFAGNTASSTQNISIDTQAPILNAGLNGTNGNNGWYKSATLTATANDPAPGSGLNGLDYTLNGADWIALGGPPQPHRWHSDLASARQ